MVEKALSGNENKERIVTSDLSCLRIQGGLFSGGVRKPQEASSNDLTGMGPEADGTQEEFSGAKDTLHVQLAC